MWYYCYNIGNSLPTISSFFQSNPTDASVSGKVVPSMDSLTSAQRKQLRALAHHLQPVVYVGKQGLTDALVQAVDEALVSHELIKVKFNDFKGEKQAISEQIAAQTRASLAGIIGNIAILYRQHPEEEKRRIRLD